MGKMLNPRFPYYLFLLCFALFHPYTLLLFFCTFNLSPQLPIPLIPLHIPVPGRAEGVIRRALGISLPVAPGLRIPNGRNAGTDSFRPDFSAMAESSRQFSASPSRRWRPPCTKPQTVPSTEKTVRSGGVSSSISACRAAPRKTVEQKNAVRIKLIQAARYTARRTITSACYHV